MMKSNARMTTGHRAPQQHVAKKPAPAPAPAEFDVEWVDLVGRGSFPDLNYDELKAKGFSGETFSVHWVGYTSPTIEPIEHLGNCMDAVLVAIVQSFAGGRMTPEQIEHLREYTLPTLRKLANSPCPCCDDE